MNTPWLNIVGVTEAGIEALPEAARALVDSAETLIGPERLLPKTEGTQNLVAWANPLAAMLEQVRACQGSQTVILATGDPNWFGIGATLSRQFAPDEFVMHPAPSAFQLAAARLHWPIQNITTISLHGRAVAGVQKHILPGARILALTSDKGTLGEVAGILEAPGYGQSILTVLEGLGAPEERISSFPASAAADQSIGDFYVLAIDCVASPDAALLSPVPGLPDDAFVHDGQLTKREVRAATLAKLSPYPGALLWDVGAGCGSVGIEWIRAAEGAKAICFERDAERLKMIETNRESLGTPSLEIIAGEAAQNLTDQPAPDAIFLGGAVGDQALFDACWQALKPGGRMVANAVTIEGETALYQRHEEYGGELTRLDIAHLDLVGSYRAMRPRMAVTQWLVQKGKQA